MTVPSSVQYKPLKLAEVFDWNAVQWLQCHQASLKRGFDSEVELHETVAKDTSDMDIDPDNMFDDSTQDILMN